MTKSVALLASTVGSAALTGGAATGVDGLAGRLAALATTAGDATFSVSAPLAPETNSYFAGRSRSTTTRVVAFASAPIRTAATPPAPTSIRFSEVAMVVFGRFTTMRAGEDSVSTLGASVPLDTISMLTPVSPRTTLTF